MTFEIIEIKLVFDEITGRNGKIPKKMFLELTDEGGSCHLKARKIEDRILEEWKELLKSKKTGLWK